MEQSTPRRPKRAGPSYRNSPRTRASEVTSPREQLRFALRHKSSPRSTAVDNESTRIQDAAFIPNQWPEHNLEPVISPVGVGAMMYSSSDDREDLGQTKLPLALSETSEYCRVEETPAVKAQSFPQSFETESALAAQVTPNFRSMDTSLQRANDFISTIKQRIQSENAEAQETNTPNMILSSSPILAVNVQHATKVQAPFAGSDHLGTSNEEDIAEHRFIGFCKPSKQWQSQDIAHRMSQMKTLKIEPTAFTLQAPTKAVFHQQKASSATSAAAQIQRAWRCKSIQQKFRQIVKQAQAATQLQTLWRSHAARNVVLDHMERKDLMLALPGTVQGRSGWYEVKHDGKPLALKLNLGDDGNWAMADGPKTKSEWKLLIRKEKNIKSSIHVALRLQSLWRSIKARKRVTKILETQGTLLSLPGTVQGQSGWYEILREKSLYAVKWQVDVEGTWKHIEGPIDKAQWRQQREKRKAAAAKQGSDVLAKAKLKQQSVVDGLNSEHKQISRTEAEHNLEQPGYDDLQHQLQVLKAENEAKHEKMLRQVQTLSAANMDLTRKLQGVSEEKEKQWNKLRKELQQAHTTELSNALSRTKEVEAKLLAVQQSYLKSSQSTSHTGVGEQELEQLQDLIQTAAQERTVLADKYQWLVKSNVDISKTREQAAAEVQRAKEECQCLKGVLEKEREDWQAERTELTNLSDVRCKHFESLLEEERDGRQSDRTRMVTQISELELKIERERRSNLNKQLALRQEHRTRLEQQMKKEHQGLLVLKRESQRFKQQTWLRDKHAQQAKAKQDQLAAHAKAKQVRLQAQHAKRQKQEHALQMQLEARLRRMESIQKEAIDKVNENERAEVKKLAEDSYVVDSRLKQLENQQLSTNYVDQKIQALEEQEERLAKEHNERLVQMGIERKRQVAAVQEERRRQLAQLEEERKRQVAEVQAAGIAQQKRIEFLQRKEEALECNEMHREDLAHRNFRDTEERLNKLKVALFIQSVVRMKASRKRLREHVQARGGLLALPGTIQGKSGWYEVLRDGHDLAVQFKITEQGTWVHVNSLRISDYYKTKVQREELGELAKQTGLNDSIC